MGLSDAASDDARRQETKGRGRMLFERLRLETLDLHQMMERQLPIFRSDFSTDAYKDLLSRYLGFYRPVEAKLASLADNGLTVFDQSRWKADLLRKDLERLEVDTHDIDSIRCCEAVPELESVSQGIGCLYVLEGSTLGGQIISRHLKQALGITREQGGAFFSSYGPELGKRWKEFKDCVCADERSTTHADEIVAAARDTFTCFHSWIMPEGGAD